MKRRYVLSIWSIVCALFVVGSIYIPSALASEEDPCIIEKVTNEKDLLDKTANGMGLRLNNGIIQRASELLSPKIPELLNIQESQETSIHLAQWMDYTFFANADGSAVYVVNGQGELVGGIDGAYVQNEIGEISSMKLDIKKDELILRSETPVSGRIHINYVNAAGNDGLEIPTYDKESFIGVPSDYVYNPSQGWAHDYCTKSPDEFNVAGNRVDFRGPCARHDLCYVRKNCRSRSCDVNLRENLKTNCRVQLAAWNPLRAACLATADVYYGVVSAVQDFDHGNPLRRCD